MLPQFYFGKIVASPKIQIFVKPLNSPGIVMSLTDAGGTP
jgi:hypothetical protein